MNLYKQKTGYKGVCQVKCVNLFDFLWRSEIDLHFHVSQMAILHHCDKLHMTITYHAP